MKPSPGTVELASLAPPLRALFEGQQATVEALRAELADRNRRLEEPGPEVLVKDLYAKVVSLTERNRNLEDRNRRLEHLVRELRRAIYAKKSEKLHPDQLLLAFEELEGALAETEADAPASTTPTPRAKRNIGHLPAHLPRVFDVIEPENILCPCGCGEMTKIGEDRTERLHIVAAKLQVIVTVRPKYTCRKCEEGVTPGADASASHRGSVAHRSHARPRAGVEVRRPPSPLPPIADLRLFRRRPAPLDTGRLGRQGVVPPAGPCSSA